jgi:hypothetical protein
MLFPGRATARDPDNTASLRTTVTDAAHCPAARRSDPPHSFLSVAIGSTHAARKAGTEAADTHAMTMTSRLVA